jgi:hypothetical protein
MIATKQKKVIISQREEIEEKSKNEKIIPREVDFLKLKIGIKTSLNQIT